MYIDKTYRIALAHWHDQNVYKLNFDLVFGVIFGASVGYETIRNNNKMIAALRMCVYNDDNPSPPYKIY